MVKLAIVDIDGVIADNTKRFENAASRKDWHRRNLSEALKPELDNPANQAQVRKGLDDFLENLFWQRAFEPSLVSLDTPIEGVSEAMNKLMEEGYLIIYLTSRPESMRIATLTWLGDHDILHYAHGGDIGQHTPA